ncbi:MAG: aspartate/glutamate racemase family protein [Actinomycetota bacterium]
MRFDIGILAGSGPEAGIDLWQAVLTERRAEMGEAYRGDRDAPSVLVRSDPRLGASMAMDETYDEVAPVVVEHAAVLDAACTRWAIACNTLNAVAPDVAAAGHAQQLVTFPAVLGEYLDAHDGDPPVLLGARPVATLGERSPYRHYADSLRTLTERHLDELHELILDVKRIGPPWVGLGERLDALCARTGGSTFLLACTELPLIASPDDRRLVDLTTLVAQALVVGLDRPT